MSPKVHTQKGSADGDDFLVGTSVSLSSHHSPCSSPQVSLKPKRIWLLKETLESGELQVLLGCDRGTLALDVVRPSVFGRSKTHSDSAVCIDSIESRKVSWVSVLLAFKPLGTLRA